MQPRAWSLASGSLLLPSWGRATVADVMTSPVLTCRPDTPLIAIARTMTTRHVLAGVIAWGGG